MSKPWSNLAKVVYKRTYSREMATGGKEGWPQTIQRVIKGNLDQAPADSLLPYEGEIIERMMLDRKAGAAGRGLWFSGAEAHKRIGGAGVNNCWYFSIDDIHNFVITQDMLMLGGGVGASVERQFVEKLPVVQPGVQITHVLDGADFYVPDSREGWCELYKNALNSFFVTGVGFTYSTKLVRPEGVPIKGFGGISSGPAPLIKFISNISEILSRRAGYKIRPIDAADMICCTGQMVVAGNVRRSAIILLGDTDDEQYLTAKRWDLHQIPNWRAYANWSVVASSVDQLGDKFWDTYKNGEPFGIVNRENIQKYGRMGELSPDAAVGVNPCGEATLESGESCNLWEQCLPNMSGVDDFVLSAKIGMRYTKRVSMEHYHHAASAEVIKRNRRVGLGITGCLAAPDLFNPSVLDHVYGEVIKEDKAYSAALGIPESKRHTVVKPSGTLSKLFDNPLYCGIHAAYSSYIIQRMRFAANDPLIPILRSCGHHIEPLKNFDGTFDWNTLVVEFYVKADTEDLPIVDKGFDTWKQLDVLLMAQKHWSDQAVSITVYYSKNDIDKIKAWLGENLNKIKAVSFLAYEDHGFEQAPWEAITKDEYNEKSSLIKEIDETVIGDGSIDLQECANGACPVK